MHFLKCFCSDLEIVYRMKSLEGQKCSLVPVRALVFMIIQISNENLDEQKKL